MNRLIRSVATLPLLFVSAGGCRAESQPVPSPAASASSPVTPSASASIHPASEASALAVDASRQPTAWDLPSKQHLIAPFRATPARGFVVMTSVRGGAAPARAFASRGGDPVDAERPVLVASFTKLWTAVATLRMVARKELRLDDTVKDLLPELATRPWADSTIRELMTHTSRVPEFDEKAGYYRLAGVDLSTPVAVLAKYVPRDWSEKQGVYKYRNAEIALLGAILAARARAPAAQVLQREVFEPAGMRNAGLLVGKAPPGLDLAPMGAIRPQNFFTAGAGYASAADLLAFFEALAGSTLLDEPSRALLFEGSAERGYGAMGCWSYAFARAEGGTTRLVERTGTFGNVRLFSAFFPEEGRAIVAWTGDGVDIARPRSGRGIGFALARVAIE